MFVVVVAVVVIIVVVPGKIVMSLSVKRVFPSLSPGGGGTYWKGTAQIGCLFGLSGLAMAPFFI